MGNDVIDLRKASRRKVKNPRGSRVLNLTADDMLLGVMIAYRLMPDTDREAWWHYLETRQRPRPLLAA